MMDYQIIFAVPDDELELRSILIESDMDIAGDIEDHVVIKHGNEIVGGGMLAQTDDDVYHLLVFAVRQTEHSRGIGSLLLNAMVMEPWRYCLNGPGFDDGSYTVTTVAKGESARFYAKNGFVACAFSELAYPFDQQCDACPDLNECKPSAMKFMGCRINDE